MRCRDIPDEQHGWTVALRRQDTDDVYECSGSEFVLDLVSEIECPPQFPVNRAHNVVQVSKQSGSCQAQKRQNFKDV